MEENKNEQDRHLQTPAEANRDKHMNFEAMERGDTDPEQDDRDTQVHFGDSTYQTKEEFEKDKGRSPVEEENNRPSIVRDDALGDKVTGADRSGTSDLSSQQNSENSDLKGSSASNASAEPGM